MLKPTRNLLGTPTGATLFVIVGADSPQDMFNGELGDQKMGHVRAPTWAQELKTLSYGRQRPGGKGPVRGKESERLITREEKRREWRVRCR